jgi:hypothetical protein
MKFPEWWEAPREIHEIDGNCGIIAAWSVLEYFGKPSEVPELTQSCRHTKRHGVFAVCLAACLKQHGLQVSFHSDPDTNIGEWERRGYLRARSLGILVQPAVDLPILLRERRRGRVPIVLYNTSSDQGHFSPLLGVRREILRLPLADDGTMPVSEFLARWTAPEILRQAIIVGPSAEQTVSLAEEAGKVPHSH